MTKPIIVVRIHCKLLSFKQLRGFWLIISWPQLISKLFVTYVPIYNAASSWPRTFFTPRVFLFSIIFNVIICVAIIFLAGCNHVWFRCSYLLYSSLMLHGHV